MADVLWIQTETGNSFWKNGKPTMENLVNYVSVSENVNYTQLAKSKFNVFWNKYDKSIVLQGNLNELDKHGRRIPFAFYMDCDNIYEVFSFAKKRLKMFGYTLLDTEVLNILSPYVKQNLVPFLTKGQLKKIAVITFVAITAITMAVYLASCSTNH